MALLGGFTFVSLQSIKSAVQLITNNSAKSAAEAGVLLRVVSTQQNATGSFIWLFDYGWQSAKLTSVYLDGGLVQGWSTSCVPIQVDAMCVVRLSSSTQGEVTLFFGGKSVAVPF